MEGKLIKLGKDDYILHVNNRPFAYKKISLKNCQAIANGYDLDELYEKVVNSDFSDKYEDGVHYYSFIEGFQKAMELMEGKKFSEEDVKKRVELVKEQFRKDVDAYGKPKKIMSTLDTIHQSLQQNEWDVEIEMEEIPNMDYKPSFGGGSDSHYNPMYVSQLKLDADGFLILKRK